MGILHLGFNGHLQQNSMLVFERYYPEQNFMIARPPRKNNSAIIDLPDSIFRWLDYGDSSKYPDILKICKEKNIDKIVLHAAFYSNVNLAEYLKAQISNCTVYWLFWGFELYNALGEDLGVNFIDEKFCLFKKRTYYYPNRVKHYLRYLRYGYNYLDVLKKISKIADYFCFWNMYDYNLYTKYFGNDVKFKLFGYVCREKNEEEKEVYNFPDKEQTIIINHQASATGNHSTLMTKIKELDPTGDFSVCMPLSYGSESIKKRCLKLGYHLFGDKFQPILKFMPRDDYFRIVDSAQVALFGQKRQEATGNIGHLLMMGTKVFLREANPLLAFYREKGYYIFSFEKDLISASDLSPLTEEQKIHNRKVWYRTRLYYDDFMTTFFD